ncbi:MAG: hypothetical protein KJZ93_17560 [Caldilineaceae bacterium]|nr:hypothetical protein [Caldilineaceae bacterium]
MFAVALLIAGLTLWLGLCLLQPEAGEIDAAWVGALLVAYTTVTAGLATVGSPWAWWLAGMRVFPWAPNLHWPGAPLNPSNCSTRQFST